VPERHALPGVAVDAALRRVDVDYASTFAPGSRIKRSCPVGRVPGVMQLVAAVEPDLPGWLSAAMGQVASWRSAIFVVVVLIIIMVGRLLAEWQRRRTLIGVIQHAPGGTVVTQERGRSGPAMRIEIGSDPNNDKTQRGGR